MSEHPHTTEGDIECSCNPLVLTVAADGSISRIAGGPVEEPIDTGPARSTPAEALDPELAAIFLAAAMKECGYTATEADARNILDYLDGDNGVALARLSPHNREADSLSTDTREEPSDA